MRTKQRVNRFKKLADWDQRRLEDLSAELGRAVRHLEATQQTLQLVEREISESLIVPANIDTTIQLAWGHWTRQLARRRQERQKAVNEAQQQVEIARNDVEKQYRRVQSWERLIDKLMIKFRREQELSDYKINDERAAIQSARQIEENKL